MNITTTTNNNTAAQGRFEIVIGEGGMMEAREIKADRAIEGRVVDQIEQVVQRGLSAQILVFEAIATECDDDDELIDEVWQSVKRYMTSRYDHCEYSVHRSSVDFSEQIVFNIAGCKVAVTTTDIEDAPIQFERSQCIELA